MKTHSFRRTVVGVGMAIALGTGTVACSDRTPPPTEPKAQSENVRAAITDTALTAEIKGRLMGEDRIESSDIHVTTTNGVVTLEGIVGSAEAKAAAETVASSVEGVRSVDNNLVTPATNEQMDEASRIASDTWITTKVKSVLLADSVGKGLEINVDTKDGVVMLEGTLDNEDAIDHVTDIAGDVEGVKSVDTSGLVVARKD